MQPKPHGEKDYLTLFCPPTKRWGYMRGVDEVGCTAPWDLSVAKQHYRLMQHSVDWRNKSRRKYLRITSATFIFQDSEEETRGCYAVKKSNNCRKYFYNVSRQMICVFMNDKYTNIKKSIYELLETSSHLYSECSTS